MGHSEAFLKIVDEARQKIQEVTIQEVAALRDRGESFILVDCREDREWDKSRIPNSIHLGKGVIERDIESAIPNPNERVIIYCGGGFRSALAVEMLQKMGYGNAASMDGGIRGWREAGLPEDTELKTR